MICPVCKNSVAGGIYSDGRHFHESCLKAFTQQSNDPLRYLVVLWTLPVLAIPFFWTEISTALMLVVMTALGAASRIPARFSRMRGFELWLPFAIIASFALGPLAGIVVGVTALAVSDFAIKDPPHAMLVAMAVTALVCKASAGLTVSISNLAAYGIMMSLLYNLVSNPVYVLMGMPLERVVRFTALSMTLDWIVYRELGPFLFNLLI